MEFIEAEEFRKKASDSIKFFPDELVAMLSKENKEIYSQYLCTEYSKKNMHFKQNFEKMFPVLDEMQNCLDTPRNVGHQNRLMNMYVKGVINQIMMERNKIVSSGLYKEEIKKQLENLTTCINDLASYEGKSTYIGGLEANIIGREGVYDYTGKQTSVIDFSKKIKEMQEMLKNDNQRYPLLVEYNNKKIKETRAKYQELKNNYDNKSKIGKFIARFTGKERELENAKQASDRTYISRDIVGQSKGDKVSNYKEELMQVENGAIVTKADYENILKIYEEENNGRAR